MQNFRVDSRRSSGYAKLNGEGRCVGFTFQETFSAFGSKGLAEAAWAKALEIAKAEHVQACERLDAVQARAKASGDAKDGLALDKARALAASRGKRRVEMERAAVASYECSDPLEVRMDISESWIAVSADGQFLRMAKTGVWAFGEYLDDAQMFSCPEDAAQAIAGSYDGMAPAARAQGAKIVRLALAPQESLDPKTMMPSVNPATGLMMSLALRREMSGGPVAAPSAAKRPGL